MVTIIDFNLIPFFITKIDKCTSRATARSIIEP